VNKATMGKVIDFLAKHKNVLFWVGLVLIAVLALAGLYDWACGSGVLLAPKLLKAQTDGEKKKKQIRNQTTLDLSQLDKEESKKKKKIDEGHQAYIDKANKDAKTKTPEELRNDTLAGLED